MKQKDIEKAKASLKAQFTRNFVAKNSRDKSGAGPHKSDKDYDRRDKQYENDALSYIGLQEQIILLKEQQQIINDSIIHDNMCIALYNMVYI